MESVWLKSRPSETENCFLLTLQNILMLLDTMAIAFYLKCPNFSITVLIAL